MNWHDFAISDVSRLSPIWKGIYNCCIKKSDIWDFFNMNTSVRVGDGSTSSFWHDRWCGLQPMKEIFSDLFVLAANPNVSVSFGWNILMSNNSINRLFGKRRLRPNAIIRMQALKNQLPQMLNLNTPDIFSWNPDVRGLKFSAASFASGLVSFCHNHSEISHDVPFSLIWDATILPKIKFFSWVFHNRLPTCPLLAHCNIIHWDAASCPYCDSLET